MHLVSKKKNVELISINENDTLHEAAEKLMNGNFHSLPVVNGDNDVVGIVTSTDLIKHLYGSAMGNFFLTITMAVFIGSQILKNLVCVYDP